MGKTYKKNIKFDMSDYVEIHNRKIQFYYKYGNIANIPWLSIENLINSNDDNIYFNNKKLIKNIETLIIEHRNLPITCKYLSSTLKQINRRNKISNFKGHIKNYKKG